MPNKSIYIKEKRCIAIFGKKANNTFWDNHWASQKLKNTKNTNSNKAMIIKIMKKYLPNEKGKILEGGCGNGSKVYLLEKNGYDVIGIDYAVATIEKINKDFPNLDVRVGDVRNLPFDNDAIAAYWSLGVIEHFWDGYDSILNEMKRVIRKEDGYLFVSFPYMSPLRKIKAILGMYGQNYSKDDIEKFYQYCLNHKIVKSDLNKKGFKVIKEIRRNPFKGLKDEIIILAPFLVKLHYSKFKLIRGMAKILEAIFLPIASHSIILIAKKENDN